MTEKIRPCRSLLSLARIEPDRLGHFLTTDRSREVLLVAKHGPQPAFSLWINRLPAEMDCDLATDFAWDWLNKQLFGTQPDHDGSNHKGFIVFNESWGNVAGKWSAIVAIGPAWAMAGK